MYLYLDNILNYDEYKNINSWVKKKKFKIGINNDGSIIKRKQLWYQKNNLTFDKKWEKYDRWCSECTYDDILIGLESLIKKYLDENNIDFNINSCLINKYNSGSDFIKFHQDSTKAFGNSFYTIILSIGETRTLQFKNDIETFEVKLYDNSLFICFPETNKNYKHSIIKDDSTGIRYSFTFRKFIDS